MQIKTLEKNEGKIKNRQSRDIGNIWVHMAQDEDKQTKSNVICDIGSENRTSIKSLKFRT
jgi:hypothetical protein